ncbi:MAG: hypothetical protein H7222_07350 [Methylotenera sp.]|nr:hypothetical protein [Oligoflexia bacterium]
MKISSIQVLFLIASSSLTLSACGKGDGSVTVQSAAYPTSGAASVQSNSRDAATVTPTATVTDFKLCIKTIKLEDEDGKAQKEEDQEEIVFSPGLIDVTAGIEKAWGNVKVPVGFKLSRIRIKVKKDQALCGVSYSLSFNGQTTPEDIEFRFKFDPAVDFEDGNTLNLSLNTVVSKLRQAIDSAPGGSISSLKSQIENVEGSGVKK